MASYEDYAEKYGNTDNLQDEIKDAEKQTEDRNKSDNQLPAKFQGKSAEEIAASYAELERSYSQQGSTLGELRKYVDDQILTAGKVEPKDELPKVEPVSLDDLYEDPDKVVRQVVQDETNARLKELENELAAARLETQRNSLHQEYPSWEQDVASPEFIEWRDSSAIRRRVGQHIAQTQDMGAARDMLSEYYTHTKAAQDQRSTQRRDADLNNASLESSGAETGGGGEQTFSRQQLMDIRISAKRGNVEAERWLRDNQGAIAYAYEEGHITD